MSKEEEATSADLKGQERVAEALPAYSAAPLHAPTAESPFDFPVDEPPPAFNAASSSASAPVPVPFLRHIAIPQITPDKAAPFLDAYSSQLLQYGITPESWQAFLTTMSAFLAAKVSEQALSHAADMGRTMTSVPKRLGQGTMDHAKSAGHDIRDAAKSGNYVGAAMGVVSAAIRLPIGTALRTVGAAVSLPATAIGAVTRKPQTPRERAAAYAEAANKKWLGVRGLRVQLVDTAELARIVRLQEQRLLDIVRASGDSSAAGQVNALKDYISKLEIRTGSTLDIGAGSLWLMIFQEGTYAPAAVINRDGKQ